MLTSAFVLADGITFSNDCKARCAKVGIASQGECSEKHPTKGNSAPKETQDKPGRTQHMHSFYRRHMRGLLRKWHAQAHT